MSFAFDMTDLSEPVAAVPQDDRPALLAFNPGADHESPSGEARVVVTELKATEELLDPQVAEEYARRGLDWEEQIHQRTKEVAAVVPEPLDPEDERFFEHLDLLGRMSECEAKRGRAHVKWQMLREDIKAAKEDHDYWQAEVLAVASEIRDLMESEPSRKKADEAPAEPEAATDPDAWRVTPTAELLVGLKGAGKKKIEAIAALAPTAGELEDLRGQASTKCEPFHALLPEGCGAKLAGLIEDRLMAHATEHGVPSAAEQVEPRAEPEPAGDADPEQAEPMGAEPECNCNEHEDYRSGEDWHVDGCDGEAEPSEAHNPAEGEEYDDVD